VVWTEVVRLAKPEMTEAQREQFEERAAIMEYEGGMPREMAEAAALVAMGLDVKR
jgi:hypothetical protein